MTGDARGNRPRSIEVLSCVGTAGADVAGGLTPALPYVEEYVKGARVMRLKRLATTSWMAMHARGTSMPGRRPFMVVETRPTSQGKVAPPRLPTAKIELAVLVAAGPSSLE